MARHSVLCIYWVNETLMKLNPVFFYIHGLHSLKIAIPINVHLICLVFIKTSSTQKTLIM